MKKFGPYELLRRMGAGATAEVFLASGPTPRGEGLLALKIILPHLAEDPAMRKGLLHEATTASALRHPHVVEIFQVGELESRPYLAMELVRGWSAAALRKKLKAKAERLGLPEACELVRQAALGLDYAHRAIGADGAPLGLVHRDVSPQNLIVSEDGVVKVVDFGLAKATACQGTQTTGLKGKLPYMPPEQLKGEALDRRADVFALGAVLFELSCGCLLYPGSTEAEVFQQALFLPQPHPDEVAKNLPRALVDVLTRAIERDRSKRTPSAGALAEALEPLTSPAARSRLGERLRACFEPLPRSAGEALGLPETPGPMPRRPSAPPQPPRHPAEPPGRREPIPRWRASRAVEEQAPEAALGQPGDTLEEDPHLPHAAGVQPAPANQEPPRAGRGRRAATAALVGACVAGGLTVLVRSSLAPAPLEPVPAAPVIAGPQRPAPAPPGDARRKGVRKGTLVLHSNVPAFVRERGVELGMTPLSIPLAAGRHGLSLVTADARLSAELEVTIAAGATVSRTVSLK